MLCCWADESYHSSHLQPEVICWDVLHTGPRCWLWTTHAHFRYLHNERQGWEASRVRQKMIALRSDENCDGKHNERSKEQSTLTRQAVPKAKIRPALQYKCRHILWSLGHFLNIKCCLRLILPLLCTAFLSETGYLMRKCVGRDFHLDWIVQSGFYQNETKLIENLLKQWPNLALD